MFRSATQNENYAASWGTSEWDTSEDSEDFDESEARMKVSQTAVVAAAADQKNAGTGGGTFKQNRVGLVCPGHLLMGRFIYAVCLLVLSSTVKIFLAIGLHVVKIC